MKNKWPILILLALCVIGMPHPAIAGQAQADDFLDRVLREPLHSIKRVYFSDVYCNSDIKADGLDIDAIKISVENKLRIAGLKIAPVSSFAEPYETRPPRIDITIDSIKIKNESLYCYSIRFEVSDYATLVQDKRVSFAYTVWEKHELGYVGTSKVATIKDSCDQFADKLVNDWLKAKDEIPNVYK